MGPGLIDLFYVLSKFIGQNHHFVIVGSRCGIVYAQHSHHAAYVDLTDAMLIHDHHDVGDQISHMRFQFKFVQHAIIYAKKKTAGAVCLTSDIGLAIGLFATLLWYYSS